MVEPFTAGILSTLIPGRVHLKKTIVRASKKPSLAANFFTPTARSTKTTANVVNSNFQVWNCREWACSASRHSIWCPVPMRPLLLQEQSQQSKPSSIRRTSQSTRDRLRHSSGRLSSELGVNRHHVSQFSSFTAGQSPDSPEHSPDSPEHSSDSPDHSPDSPDHSKSFQRLRNLLEPSILPIQPSFSDSLEACLADIEPLLPDMPEDELLELLYAIADKLDEMLYPPFRDPIRICEWGKRLEKLCDSLPEPRSRFSPKKALLTRVDGMMGVLPSALDYFQEINIWDDYHLRASGTVLLAIAFHQGLFRALGYFIIGLPSLAGGGYFSVNHIIKILISREPNILAFIPRAIEEGWNARQKKHLGYHLLLANSEANVLLDLVKQLRENDISITRKHILKTSKIVSEERNRNLAVGLKLYDSLPVTNDYDYIQTGLYLASRSGNAERVQILFDALKARGSLDPRDTANMLLLYAQQGRIKELRQVFDQYFPKSDEGGRLNGPNTHHYSIVMLAHARDGDFEGVTSWLEDMQESGVQPNSYTFTSMIQAFAKMNNLQGLSDVFSQLRKLGAKPDAATYTVLISVFADRKDSESADALFKLAIAEGIIPDAVMTRTLMDAHVSAGSFKGATQIFDYLSSQFRTTEYLPLEVYNMVIKAHVMIAAPFRIVARLFFRVKEMGLSPDKFTYSLLVMSACDSGMLRTASDIYQEMVRTEEEDPSTELVSAHVLTMIMAGFLRQGNKTRAKEIYDEMIERGIQPSGVTYGTIVKSYGKDGTAESLRIAEDFIKRLVSVPKEDQKWNKDTTKGKPALVQLYSPLLHAHSLKRDVDECERLYGEYLEAGGKPTIAMLSHILEAYRRSADVQGALSIWPHIAALASTVVFNTDIPDQTFTSRPPGIHIPLSIYIDSLSFAGLHTEIALVWRDLYQKGQRFDAHNWNHFAVALIRAGQLLPAFEIVEKVLLRYLEAKTLAEVAPEEEERDKKPISALSDSTDEGEIIAGVPLQRTLQTMNQMRMHASDRREAITKKTFQLLRTDVLMEEAPDTDFIHPLQSLQKITSNWNKWRPHVSVLRTFLVSYLLLERGYIIRPIRRGELTRDNVADVDFNQRDDDAARDMLKTLRETCPDTVTLVKEYQSAEWKRLGAMAFERMYTWR